LPSDETLLKLLADGEFRSGQMLAETLGVSRTAVWKHLGQLAGRGLDLETVRGRGYRIRGGLDLLDAASIRAGLGAPAAALPRELQVVPVIDSTNSELMRRADSGASSGLVLAAEQQSAGRGRRNKHWVSPFAGSLYVSVLWEFSDGVAALEGLSLAVGVVVAAALARCGQPPVSLKWPNDILFGGAKLGGILLEIAGDAAGPCKVIVGIGLNVRLPAASAAGIEQPWTDLASLSGRPLPPRSVLLAALLHELLPLLADYQRQGFGHWQAAWQARDAYAGQPVTVISGERRTAGIARGVNERGALLLETAGGMHPVYGGEVSLRASP